ncbi:MAG: hypothetical protein CME88_12885 [Hirschia sp.]|nr:hypothetical protein [Hirschia sp.]MBF19264.1 hypothetical protein [Hirschia sp.]
MKELVLLFVLLFIAAACEQKPKHYFVLCQNIDGNGWRLIDFKKDKNGYITSCTYQSPDTKRVKVHSCDKNGCY